MSPPPTLLSVLRKEHENRSEAGNKIVFTALQSSLSRGKQRLSTHTCDTWPERRERRSNYTRPTNCFVKWYENSQAPSTGFPTPAHTALGPWGDRKPSHTALPEAEDNDWKTLLTPAFLPFAPSPTWMAFKSYLRVNKTVLVHPASEGFSKSSASWSTRVRSS